MAKLDQAKEQLITKIDELFGFNLSNKQDGVSYDFGQYRLNKLYKPLVKYFIEQFLTHLEGYTPQEAEKVLGLFSDFFSLYYSNGDFGYFKNKFSTYQYRIPYSGKDTEFWRATKDCYYVKTSDVVNDMAVSLGGMFDGKEIALKLFKKTESTTTESGEEKYTFDIQIEEIIDEESEEMTGYKIIFINREESSDRRTTKEAKIKEFLQDQGIDYNTPGVKKTIDEFLKKRGRDYFIHKRLKAFLTEELERYFFQMLKTDLQAKADILSIQTKIEEIKAKYSDDPSVIDFKIGQLMKESQGDIKLSLYETAYLWILNYINILADLEEFKAKLWNKKRKVTKEYRVIALNSIKKNLNQEKILAELSEIITLNKDFEREVKGIIADKYRDSLQGKYVSKIYFDFKNKKIKLTITKFKKNKSINKLLPGFVLNEYMLFENQNGELLFENSRGEIYTPEFSVENSVDLLSNLYIDSKYIDFNKLDIELSDEDINGTLIKSENYQALKYYHNNEIDLIRIDPPFNTENNQFYYKDNYLDSSRLSLMYDRITVASIKATDYCSIYIHLDENGEYFTRYLCSNLCFRRTLFRNSGGVGFKGGDNWIRSGDIINHFGIGSKPIWNASEDNKLNGNILNTLSVQDSRFNNKENLGSFWRIKGTTQKTEDYVSRYIHRSSNKGSIVLDFFMGTGTTPAVCHKTGRKYVGIEMGDHFDLIVIKRMKKVLIGDQGGISNNIDEQGTTWQGGGSFAYLYLNQYEDRFNAGGYLDSIEGDIIQLSNADLEQVSDIKQVLFLLAQLKEKIYGLDDQLLTNYNN